MAQRLREREDVPVMGASFSSSAGNTPVSKPNVSDSAVCATRQSKPETHSSKQCNPSVKKHPRIMSQPSSETSINSSRHIQSEGNARCHLSWKGRGRVRVQSSSKAVVASVGASIITQRVDNDDLLKKIAKRRKRFGGNIRLLNVIVKKLLPWMPHSDHPQVTRQSPDPITFPTARCVRRASLTHTHL